MKKLVVLISGNGSNLQAIIDAINSGVIPNTEISLVISNKASAFGLERAQKANIETKILSGKNFPTREQYDAELRSIIDTLQPNLIVLAGFMRILSAEFVKHFTGKLINIHPSLLPKYKGLDTHKRALAAGDSIHGATVHLVTEELDAGPIIAQSQCVISANDDEHSLQEKVHQIEHEIYPLAIAKILASEE